MSGLQTLVFPEELWSTVAKATLVSTCTACMNRSKGSKVGVWLEGTGELGSRMLGGPGDGRLLLLQDRDSVHKVVLHEVHSGGVGRTQSCGRH